MFSAAETEALCSSSNFEGDPGKSIEVLSGWHQASACKAVCGSKGNRGNMGLAFEWRACKEIEIGSQGAC